MTVTQRAKHPVLLVDDEPEILFSLKGLLRREFELYTAEDGNEAMRILHDHPIHVIMTDQRMPQMTGVELMGRVKTEYPDAIRIIFTGYADIKAVIDAINRGALYRYVTKPWDPDELIELLHDATAQYDALVQRRHVLADLRQYVEEGRRLAERILDQRTRLDPSDVSRFIDSGEQLLRRLEQQQDDTRRSHPTIPRQP
ncbi:MAG: response regulator [Pirellulaceae bacterium]